MAPAADAGGGWLAGGTAAAAARLVAAAAERSLGWAQAPDVVRRANLLAEELDSLADHVEQAYRRAREALDAARVARAPDEERNARLGGALAIAGELPLEVARLAAEVTELAAEGAERADEDERPNCVVAAHLAAASVVAAGHLTRVNLTVVNGDAPWTEAGEQSDRALRAVSRAIAKAG